VLFTVTLCGGSDESRITRIWVLFFCYVCTTSQVARGLLLLLNHRCLHLDLKATNVMLRHGAGAAPVLIDFGCVKTLPSDDLTYPANVVINPAPWGNADHIAPELHVELARARAMRREALLNFTGQPAFELGVLAYEICLGEHPIDNYPRSILEAEGLTSVGGSGVGLDPAAFAASLPRLPSEYPAELEALCRRLLSLTPADRPHLAEVVATVEALRRPGPLARVTSLASPLAGPGLGLDPSAVHVGVQIAASAGDDAASASASGGIVAASGPGGSGSGDFILEELTILSGLSLAGLPLVEHLNSGGNGMVLAVKCPATHSIYPDKRYALKGLCSFSFFKLQRTVMH
jgi:hypothetical protein